MRVISCTHITPQSGSAREWGEGVSHVLVGARVAQLENGGRKSLTCWLELQGPWMLEAASLTHCSALFHDGSTEVQWEGQFQSYKQVSGRADGDTRFGCFRATFCVLPPCPAVWAPTGLCPASGLAFFIWLMTE